MNTQIRDAGVWIDGRKALIADIDESGVCAGPIRRVSTELEKQLRLSSRARAQTAYGPQVAPPDDMREASSRENRRAFFEAVAAAVNGARRIFVFGPGEPKHEFHRRLQSDGMGARVDAVETAGFLTDRQVAARVRAHFGVVLWAVCALSSFAHSDTIGEPAPPTVSTALPSNISQGVPGDTSNPTLNSTPAQNPAPTPAPERVGASPLPDPVPTQAPVPTQTPAVAPVAVAAAVAAPSAPPPASTGPSVPIAEKPASADRRRARAAATALRRAFPATPGADGVQGLTVAARGGKLILRGTVSTQRLKDAVAAKAAAIVGGAADVDDQLVVR
jgi:hypothetical protein